MEVHALSTLAIDDYKLNYTYRFISADHPTLLLVHGLSQDSEIWDSFISHLNPGFNVATYDFFGHGRTTWSAGRASIDRLIDEAVTLIHALNLKHVHLVGNYFGGLFGVRVAERCMDVMDSLILFSSPFFAPKGSYKQELRYMEHLIKKDRPMLGKVFAMRAVHPVTPAKSKYIVQSFNRMNPQAYLDILKDLEIANDSLDFAALDNLQSLNIPILFLNGEYDNLLPQNLAMAFSVMVPNSRGFVIPGAGRHFVIDDPKTTAHFVNKFILDDHFPVQITPMYQQSLDHFRKIIMDGYKKNLHNQYVLQIRVSGGAFQVMWNGSPIEGTWNQRNAKELLLFLVMNQGTASREQIIDALRPEIPVAQAKNRLRVDLAHLNKLFREHPDPSARHILIINRTAITLDVEVSCDFLNFSGSVDRLKTSAASLSVQANQFVDLVDHYHPESLFSLGGEWLNACIGQIDSDLGHVMTDLVENLEKEGQAVTLRAVLRAGEKVEPYEGFCKEKLRLQNLKKKPKKAE